jgi:hypothetical protein
MVGRSSARVFVVRTWFWFSSLAVVAGCGSDDRKDREPSPYPGVTRWDCFANTATGVCDCYGLGPGDDLSVGGSDIEEVDECSGYTECKTFYDDEFNEWFCSCGPTGFTPGLHASGSASLSEKEVVPECPPEG